MESGNSPIGGVSGVSETFQLSDITSDISTNAEVEHDVSQALSHAVDSASSLPGKEVVNGNPRAQMFDTASGDYGSEKQGLLSDVVLDGAENSATPEEDDIAVIADSLKGLMQELTTWHVTWGIAQTAQKDLTHVLKS